MYGPHKLSWPTERLDKLTALLANGYSASQAGAEMGCSRNAIIGIAHRKNLVLKWSHTPSRPKAAAPRSTTPRRAAAINFRKRATVAQARGHRPQTELPALPPPSIDTLVVPAEQRRSILDLKANDCRWPFGDPGTVEFYFCGGMVREGDSYCPHHCRLAYRRPGQVEAAA